MLARFYNTRNIAIKLSNVLHITYDRASKYVSSVSNESEEAWHKKGMTEDDVVTQLTAENYPEDQEFDNEE